MRRIVILLEQVATAASIKPPTQALRAKRCTDNYVAMYDRDSNPKIIESICCNLNQCLSNSFFDFILEASVHSFHLEQIFGGHLLNNRRPVVHGHSIPYTVFFSTYIFSRCRVYSMILWRVTPVTFVGCLQYFRIHFECRRQTLSRYLSWCIWDWSRLKISIILCTKFHDVFS